MGKTLLSRIDPVSQAERLAAEFDLKEKTLYLCPSPLYGYGISLLIERLKPNSAILCVEADEKLFELSQKTLGGLAESGNVSGRASPFSPASFALTAETAPENLCAFVRKRWGKRFFRRVEVIRLTGGWQLFPQLYENIETTLRREIALEWGNALTLIRLGRLYSRNLIRNLALLDETGAPDFGSDPILALGAGPSLDPLLDEFSRFSGGKIPAPGQRRFKIICVDTCLPALDERGILPDLVVILESQHWNIRDFTGLRGRKINAATDLSSLPASIRVLDGKRYFFATIWTELALLRRLEDAVLLPETYAPLGSVGLSSVAMALRVSSGPVLTGGIDFSFTLDASHARSTPGHRGLENSSNRFKSFINPAGTFSGGTFPTLSKSGIKVRSNPAMRNYRDLFEDEFSGNSRLLDIEGSGLNLGLKIVPMQEAFAILEGSSCISPNKSRMEAGEHIPLRKEKLSSFVRREIDTLNELKKALSGTGPSTRLEELLDYADYLWAHFPENAGAGRQKPCTDIGFLKRVRVEIEPFLKLWEMTLGELGTRQASVT